ncbi:DUF2490 domain-containing protein [Parabacteroides sp. AM08-6]|uniref:DUF2490 domain-containing protein n=1 Tax=Parabacteroides sp. AM08-6 TaxID=2292053 RepID=UPI000F0026E0|nr:DUF2490 domain-containing protein [Parabacteroides sp. AM08-6]RHJ83456.1 DUF2490 domain-containing protein [Parabacteroides sp. AM08-6]
MKNNYICHLFYILSILLLSVIPYEALLAMDGTGIAFKISMSGKLYHNFSFLIEEDIRPRDDFRQAEWFLTTGEINYLITHNLKAGIGYMSLCRYKASDELRNRYYIYACGTYPLSIFTFSIRERFQSTYKIHAEYPKNYLRSMLTVSCKIGKSGLVPFIYAELFNDAGHHGKMHTDRIRLSAGSDYKLNKQNSIQVYYRYHIFNTYDPVNYKHAIGITYSHRF